MNTTKLQKIVVDALEDVKATDIEVINVTKLTSLFDRVIIASGSSNRQTRALANNVVVKVKEAGGEVLSTEGEDTGEWVLVDLGDVVVHVMQPAIRAYYNLEELWSTTPSKRGKLIAANEAAHNQ
ncbi:ribosome silencing factor [Uliginosibacterium sp. 31-16]|uniref:ribosome silencing factor n=1 Tax=Uliginosibacterium sp. 31-16 TaxID=3068315 RepID=UPI00273FDCB7|nr:ribosome silencing factor [Uliginosibacterium sp. 31-16]MDP5239082.1 ribosome silencing factor [Uliginosibacterium sp. 31-16]